MSTEHEHFTVGEQVRWLVNGTQRRKRARIIAVVPPGTRPRGFGLRNVGEPRDHRSYVIHARGRTKSGSTYWPLVQHLRKVRRDSEQRTAEKDSLTTAELAARWEIEAVTLRNWRFIGKGPPYFKPSGNPRGATRYKIRDVEAYEQKHRVGGDV